MTRPRIYIAGPIRVGDLKENIRCAMDAWHELWRLGFAPFCPHLSCYLDRHNPLPFSDWLKYDFCWLDLCDAVLRLPGLSEGADIEEARAIRLGIPVFCVPGDLKKWADERDRKMRTLSGGLEK